MTNESEFGESGYCNLPPYRTAAIARTGSPDTTRCRQLSESSETESHEGVDSSRGESDSRGSDLRESDSRGTDSRGSGSGPVSGRSAVEDADTTLVNEEEEDGVVEGMSTIRRVVAKPEPVRPPRSIDNQVLSLVAIALTISCLYPLL